MSILPGRPRRYISRPALSEARLELTDQGMVSYVGAAFRLKSAYRDGTTHVVFDRGGLPPLDRDAQSLWPNWQRWYQGLAPT